MTHLEEMSVMLPNDFNAKKTLTNNLINLFALHRNGQYKTGFKHAEPAT